jgi:uncharacterized membrane protein required for colicin V production
MPDLAQWILNSLPSWPVLALIAVVILYFVLRIVRRAVRVSLRLAIIAGTLAVIAVALLVLKGLLREAGLPLP